MNKVFGIEFHSGKPIFHAGRTIIPFSRIVYLRVPGTNFAGIWNKPVSLLIQHPDGQEEIRPIPDPTRTTILAILAGALAFWLVFQKITRMRLADKSAVKS